MTLSHSYEGLEVAVLNPLRGIDSRLNRPWAPTFQRKVIGARRFQRWLAEGFNEKNVCAVRVSSSHGSMKVCDFSKFQWTMGWTSGSSWARLTFIAMDLFLGVPCCGVFKYDRAWDYSNLFDWPSSWSAGQVTCLPCAVKDVNGRCSEIQIACQSQLALFTDFNTWNISFSSILELVEVRICRKP